MPYETSVAIVRDGKLVASALEERFTRVKHTASMPVHSLRYCLDAAGVTLDEVDHFAYPFNDRLYARHGRSRLRESARSAIRHPGSALRSAYVFLPYSSARSFRSLVHGWVERAFDLAGMAHQVPTDRIHLIEHHRAHAATAFYHSGMRNAAVLVADGAGETASTTAYAGHEAKLIERAAEPISKSLGYFYMATTEYLGWRRNEGEGKTMGLAPYGKPSPAINMEKLLSNSPEGWTMDRALTQANVPPVVTVERALGLPRRRSEDPLGGHYPDVAFAAQRSLEVALVTAARKAMRLADSGSLCLSGGVALNCKANMAVREALAPNGIYISAPAGDGGTPAGAALALAADLGELKPQHIEHDYWGPEFTAEAIEEILARRGMRYERPPDIAKATADLIAEGNIVGWFQGRMELGPRSLGNRAVLADPREASTRDRLNDMKARERWRPLCPSMLAERASEFLEDPTDAPFMILSFRVRPEAQKEIAAAVHVDGTTRPQAVKREVNPLYHRLISEFARRSGTPVLLNTSFNLAGYPIVATPLQALTDSYMMGLDALALGPFLLRRAQ